MSAIHDRPRLSTMLRPGHKPADLHRAITKEIERLSEREERVVYIAHHSASAFGRQLAAEAAERIAERRERLLTSPRWGRNRP